MPMSLPFRILLVCGLAVLFVVGFFLGQRAAGRPVMPAPTAPELPVEQPASANLSALEAAERRGRQLQGQVETLELALHAARGTQLPEPEPVAAETDAPWAFPETLPEQFTPAGFERIVRDVVRECDLGVELSEIDCSEYPCLAWVRSKDLEQTHVTPSACPAWRRAFSGDAPLVTYGRVGNPFGGRTERFHVWVVLPPTPVRNANQPFIDRGEERMKARWDAMHAGSAPCAPPPSKTC